MASAHGAISWNWTEKYYLNHNYQSGWALGLGITHNTGLKSFNENLETVYGNTETVTLDLHPQTNVFVAAYRYWKLGRRANRMYLELGWSVPVTSGDKYTETVGDPLSSTSNAAIKLIAPGGPVVGFGFSFGVH